MQECFKLLEGHSRISADRLETDLASLMLDSFEAAEPAGEVVSTGRDTEEDSADLGQRVLRLYGKVQEKVWD